jgi:FkbM family methyltransferase
MFKCAFKLIEKLIRKFYTPNNNPLLRGLKYFYYKVKIIAEPAIVKSNENTVVFFVKNAERVNIVANMLADEQSKREYLGMIKFRQTRNKKDYPKLKYEHEYFFNHLQLGKDEVFIDCGAYIGDTIDEFLKRCPEYKQIVAFEPETENFRKLKKKHGTNSKITLINAGVYDKEGETLFERQDGLSRIIQPSSSPPKQDDWRSNFMSIQLKTIDNLKLENVSFIKMDIEGAELNALKGAEKTIIKNKPKLAICLYHSDEDMIRLAEYIHNLISEYKLYVRHYSFYPSISETVLYAIPRKGEL